MNDDETPKARPIGSREYKLILTTDRFSDHTGATTALQDIVCRIAEQFGAKTERQQEEERRRTHYLDTAGADLRRAGFLLRIRFEEQESTFKLSLKHRSPDRYLAAAQDLTLSKAEGDLKFEEDILPPFHSMFSQSNSFRSESEPEIRTVGSLIDLFPGLKQLGMPDDARLEVVNQFRPVEQFIKLCKVKFGDGPKIKFGLSIWRHSANDVWPMIAELAFDYETEEGDEFDLQTVEGANRMYSSLQRQPGWINTEETTKTGFAYDSIG